MKLFGQRIFDYGEGLHRITQGISNVVSDSKVPERLDKDRWKFDRLLESIDVDGVYNDKAIEDMTIDDMNIDSITGRIKQTIGLTNSSEAFQKAFEYFRDAQSAYLADMASDFHESQSQMQRELNNQDKGDVLASCFLYKYENDAAALAAFKEALYRRNRGSIYDLALDFMERVSSPVLIWIDPKDPEPAPEQPPAAKPIRVAKPVYKASAPSSVKTTPLSQDHSHTSRNICIGILVVLICLFGFLVHKLTAVYMDETANQNIVTPQAQTKSEPKEEKPTVIAKTDLSLCGIDIGDNKNSVYEVLQLENSNKKGSITKPVGFE